jgi:hypothetical protein
MSLSARNWAWETDNRPRIATDPPAGSEDVPWLPLTPAEKLVLLCLAELENAAEGVCLPVIRNHRTPHLPQRADRAASGEGARRVRVGSRRARSSSRRTVAVVHLPVPRGSRGVPGERPRMDAQAAIRDRADDCPGDIHSLGPTPRG